MDKMISQRTGNRQQLSKDNFETALPNCIRLWIIVIWEMEDSKQCWDMISLTFYSGRREGFCEKQDVRIYVRF